MDENDLVAYISLSFVPRMGWKSLERLYKQGKPSDIIKYDRNKLVSMGLTQSQVSFLFQKSPYWTDLCMRWLQEKSHHILTPRCIEYPALLKEISATPPLLFIQGNLASLSYPQIAVVGSRHPSQQAQKNTWDFVEQLKAFGLTITSGLAMGVDSFAHQAALKDSGLTVAVLGAGLENIYPKRNVDLAMQIAEKGALVSEFMPYTPPRAEHFPRRNRIISGLSLAVLVIEAAEKSGSLITAKYALEQGREVFALPHSPHAYHGRGSNALIKSGAILAQSAHDIVAETQSLLAYTCENIQSLTQDNPQKESYDQSQHAVQLQQSKHPFLLSCIGNTPLPVDIIVERVSMPLQNVMSQLLELEMEGYIKTVSGGYVLC